MEQMSGTNEKNFVLYLHITPSGKKYFGITGQKPEKRWRKGNGYSHNKHFVNAIEKYGWNSIAHIILADDLTKEDAYLFEQILIALYDTTDPNKGYNLTTGGDHFNHSETVKRRMSSKPVICLTTKRIFYGPRSAGRAIGIPHNRIIHVCKGRKKHAGRTADGTLLKWRYLNHNHNKIYHIVGGYYVDKEQMMKLLEDAFPTDGDFDFESWNMFDDVPEDSNYELEDII